MKRGGVVLELVTVLVLVVGLACGATTTSKTTASSAASAPRTAATSPTPAGNGKLDPAVKMPDGFPSDFPIYAGARLTKASQVTANGQTTWGMEWETLDSADQVQSWYMTKLNQGDWTLAYSSTGSTGWSAIFARKSNSKDGGLLTIEPQSNVTHITLGFGTT